MKKAVVALGCAFLIAPALHGAVVFQNLGTAAPPTTVGTFVMTPFAQAPQAAIADFTSVTSIPGGPAPLGIAPASSKRTIGASWATWSHGYTGVIYFDTTPAATLTLPANVGAFYFYAEPQTFSIQTVTAVTNLGTSSGPISVNGSGGANGFGFWTTAGESIASITITTSDVTGMGIGEFGSAPTASAAQQAIPTLSLFGLLALAAALAAGGIIFLRARLSA